MKTRFSETTPISISLKKAAKVAMKDVLGAKKEERVLIISNPEWDIQLISKALYDASLNLEASPTLIFQQKKTQLDFAEDAVVKAMESIPEIMISISKEKRGKDRIRLKEPIVVGQRKYDDFFRYLLEEKKSRSFWSPNVTLQMFSDAVPIDYSILRKRCKKVGAALEDADGVQITSPSGTDVYIGLKGRKPRLDDGDFREPGKYGNLPAGEVYISPELGASQGRIAYDGSISLHEGEVVLKEPIAAEIKDGFVIDIKGGEEAKALEKTIKMAQRKALSLSSKGALPKEEAKNYVDNARNLGELGIGLNPKAKIIGNMLLDEKVYGTCHIAIGSNYEEDARALIHLDGLIKKPTITAFLKSKEVEIMERGELIL